MKILLVSSFLDDGGAEKWMLDTIKNMDRTGVEIDYYFWCDIKIDTFVKDYESLGVNLYFRKLNEKKSNFMLKLKKDFIRFCKEQGPYDAVHLNGTKITFQMVIMNSAKKLHIPVRIVHSHNPFVNELSGLKNRLREVCKNRIYKDATVISGCSELVVHNLYGDQVLNSPKFHLFQNGIDLKRFSESNKFRSKYRDELGLKKDDNVYLHIGRFSKEKNHTFLVDVFSEILKINNNSKLILIGKGPEEDSILKKIEKLGLKEEVIHIPYTSETEKYYAAADEVLFPSLYEGLPLVLLEAQANGIPCIISSKITKKILINENTRHVNIDSSQIWAAEAINIIGKRCDKAFDNLYNKGYELKKTAQDFLDLIRNGVHCE